MRSKTLKHALGLALGLVVGVSPLAATAAPYDIADAPLFLSVSVPPNVALTLDDSGSMAWAYAPDGISGLSSTKRFKSADFNPLYYNPEVTYEPPVDENGTPYSTSFTKAWINGFEPGRGWRDLSDNYRPTYSYNPARTNQSYARNPGDDFPGDRWDGVPAYYYYLDESKAGTGGCPDPVDRDDDDCYTLSRSDHDNWSDEEKQNFANWYSFYRTRNLAVASASTLAFAQLSGEVRVAWQALNRCDDFDTNCTGWTGTRYDSRLDRFSEDHREDFYDWLSRLPASGGTPLRSALVRSGEMFKENRAYREEPSNRYDTKRLECRQNFAVVMTDGIWNGNVGAVGNVDGSSRTLPDGTTYTPIAPYDDDDWNSLADIAFHYWATDLRPDLDDHPTLAYLPVSGNETIEYDDPSTGANPDATTTLTEYQNPRNDPATWQHMVTFTVGVGLTDWLTLGNRLWEGDTYAGGYKAFATDYAQWPNTYDNAAPANVYDLWHAALNSRGQFFSVESPDEIVDAFKTIIQRVQARRGSASALSLNSGSVSSETQFYQALFDSSDWSGSLWSRPISDGHANLTCTTEARGEICPTAWDAACGLTGGRCEATGATMTALDWDSERQIITYDGSQGVAFRWSDDLTAAQKAYLEDGDGSVYGQARLDFLRGDRGCEEGNNKSCAYDLNGDSVLDAADKQLRARASLLGDIVNSTPLFIGPPDKLYWEGADWKDVLHSDTNQPENGAAQTYQAFADANKTRLNLVAVGANDGMLHLFRAGRFDSSGQFDNSLNDGREVLAYVPTAVYPNLARLSDPGYKSQNLHKYFVDGKLEATDAYFDGAWHTVLVGGLGAGGQAIFALDVTDPGRFSEANADDIVLWEFTDAYDDGTYTGADLGYTYGQPHVVRLHNGRWGVIVGNGYNNTAADGAVSATGNAVLYVLDLETGTVLAKLDTGVGVSASYSGGRPNGLAEITPVDLDGDVITDYVYAGDLFGNVWRFDLTATDPTQWKVDDYGTDAPTPLFVATDTSTPPKRQPITTSVLVDKHPRGIQYGGMVYFGTGKYFETTDGSADLTTNHTMYGVQDSYFPAFNIGLSDPDRDANHNLDRGDLTEQKIESDFDNPLSGERQRILSNYQVDYTTSDGWYVDLLRGNSSYDTNGTTDTADDTVTVATSWTREGEMVASDPALLGKLLIVSTLIPSDDECSSGGRGTIMVFNTATGGRVNFSPLYRSVGDKPVQGVEIGGTTAGTPNYLSGKLLVPLGDTSQGNQGTGTYVFDAGEEGRRSWRQLR